MGSKYYVVEANMNSFGMSLTVLLGWPFASKYVLQGHIQ